MKIYDKATWQIDNGISSDKVIECFNAIFSWLESKDLLSEDGKEMLDIGIDSSISLNENMVNEKGNLFLTENYDEIVKQVGYNKEKVICLLNNAYEGFSK